MGWRRCVPEHPYSHCEVCRFSHQQGGCHFCGNIDRVHVSSVAPIKSYSVFSSFRGVPKTGPPAQCCMPCPASLEPETRPRQHITHSRAHWHGHPLQQPSHPAPDHANSLGCCIFAGPSVYFGPGQVFVSLLPRFSC